MKRYSVPGVIGAIGAIALLAAGCNPNAPSIKGPDFAAQGYAAVVTNTEWQDRVLAEMLKTTLSPVQATLSGFLTEANKAIKEAAEKAYSGAELVKDQNIRLQQVAEDYKDQRDRIELQVKGTWSYKVGRVCIWLAATALALGTIGKVILGLSGTEGIMVEIGKKCYGWGSAALANLVLLLFRTTRAVVVFVVKLFKPKVVAVVGLPPAAAPD